MYVQYPFVQSECGKQDDVDTRLQATENLLIFFAANKAMSQAVPFASCDITSFMYKTRLSFHSVQADFQYYGILPIELPVDYIGFICYNIINSRSGCI